MANGRFESFPDIHKRPLSANSGNSDGLRIQNLNVCFLIDSLIRLCLQLT